MNSKCVRAMTHGDDTAGIGYREIILPWIEEMKKSFVCKVKFLILLHEEDDKEAKFLKRTIRVTAKGWEYEADVKHVKALIERYQLDTNDAKTALTPGIHEKHEEVAFETEEERDAFDPPLVPPADTEHRAGVGTASFLAGDRIDIKFPVKEIQRDGAKPRQSSVKKMKRLVRYLKRVPRFVNFYRWQRFTKDRLRTMQTAVDADHAGCLRTRKSTTCCIIRIGNHVIQDVSVTQPGLPALSSGESEYRAAIRATVESLYIQNLMKFLRILTKIDVETDSSAAKGTAGRLGAGRKLRHLETAYFFLQDLVKSGVVVMKKVKGTEQIADIGTKHLSWAVMSKLFQMMDVKLLTLAGMSILPGVDGAAEMTITVGEIANANYMVEYMTEQMQSKAMLLMLVIIIMKVVWVIGEKLMIEGAIRALLGLIGYGEKKKEKQRLTDAETQTEIIEVAEEPVAAPVVPVRRVVRKVHTYHYGMNKVFMCSTGVRSCTLKVHTSAACQTLRGRASTTTVIPLDMCRLCGGENVRTEEEDLDGQEQIRIGHAIELQVEDR